MFTFRRLAALAPLTLTVTVAQAAAVTDTIDTRHSRITFHDSHLGFSNPIGEFKLAEGPLTFDPDDWSASRVDAHIPVSSLQLGDVEWNAHIQSKGFLEAATYPNIAFTSTKVETTGGLHGKLKIGEHTLRKTAAVGFTATTSIKRSDFGITAYLPTVVGDGIEVRVEIEAYVPPPAKT